MDDPAQNKNPVVDNANVTSQTHQDPGMQHQPSAQISTPAKEHAPFGGSEHIKPAGPEAVPNVPAEVAKHVEVSPNPEQPHVTPVRHLGVTEAKESTPAPQALSNASQFPYTPEQIAKEKEYSVLDSFRWRLVVFGRQLKRALLKK